MMYSDDDMMMNNNKINVVKEQPFIIGLCGKKRSGKDTIGNHLVEKHGFYRLAFADPLKIACQEIFGFSDAQTFGNDKEAIDPFWNHSPRQIFQAIGTDLLRNTLPQYCHNMTEAIWIQSIDRKISTLMKQGITKFVITDVRFPDEFKYAKYGKDTTDTIDNSYTWNDIHEKNYREQSQSTNRYMWKVFRHDCNVNKAHLQPIEHPQCTALHSSELSLDCCSCDVEFLNNDTIDALLKNVDDVLLKISK